MNATESIEKEKEKRKKRTKEGRIETS